MIRFTRGNAPTSLKNIRIKELRRVREQRRRGEVIDFGQKYKVKRVRDALFQVQQWKCCYCEIMIREKGSHIEHFRPKAKALRGPDFPAEHGYWWLAWNWDNLFLTCQGCNDTKLDHFPLDPAGRVLPRGWKPPGPELPLLVDPTLDDPLKEIRFIRLKGHWRPVPRQLSLRGKVTIRRLALDAPDLVEFYDYYVQEHIDPQIHQVRTRIAANDPRGAQAAWSELLRVLFGPKAPYQALSYDVIEENLSAPMRAAWGLSLPQPGVTRRPRPSVRKPLQRITL